MFCANCGNKMNDDAKFCPKCGAKTQGVTDTEPASEELNPKNEINGDTESNIKKKKPVALFVILGVIAFLVITFAVLFLTVPKLKCMVAGHEWAEATCTDAKTCTRCGLTEGKKLGHDYSEATCTKGKICKRCNKEEGSSLGHDYEEATCTAGEICRRCNNETGDPLGHAYNDATCETPMTCVRCGVIDGYALGHSWDKISSSDPDICYIKVCSLCGETNGEIGHHFVGGDYWFTPQYCSNCNKQGTLLTAAMANEQLAEQNVNYTISVASKNDSSNNKNINAEYTDYAVGSRNPGVELERQLDYREGYEWRIATVQVVWYEDDMDIGYSFSDYYTGAFYQKNRNYTITYTDKDQSIEVFAEFWLSGRALYVKAVANVPVGYDGIVFRLMGDDRHGEVNTLLFRLD